MKRLLLHISILLVAALLTHGCIQDIFISPFDNGKEGELVNYTINFGAPEGGSVTVSTKGDLGIVRESSIFNVYLLIFDNTGKKLYGHYFNGDNLNAADRSNWWTVSNLTATSGQSATTTGTLHIQTTTHSDCTLVAVANLNPNDLDVSSGLLATIRNYSDLQTIIATQIRSEVTANSGYFLMTGRLDSVDIEGNSSNPDDLSYKVNNAYTHILQLERIYAKVTFNVRVAPQSYTPGQGEPTTRINSFVPDKWQVINVPTCSYLLERPASESNHDAADSDDEFFNTEAINFEKETPDSDCYYGTDKHVSTHSFTFYMMENRNQPLSSPSGGWEYKHREKQVKATDGTNGAFEFANKYSTYVILSGKITMDNVTHGSNANATLEATVQYKIHLGNFDVAHGGSYGDFLTERNHNYIYNVYIYGVNDIRTEVTTGVENEPGATGSVLVADEKIFTSDCHYSTHVISFHAANLSTSDDVTWYVETPFNKEGIQYQEYNDGTNNLGSIDYKWIEFRLNEQTNGAYSQKRELYYPHDYDWERYAPDVPPEKRTKYVNEIVEFLKAEKAKYDNHEPSAFDEDPSGAKISFTAFVNEFYYSKNPISDRWDPTLWKNYIVNQPMRKMHIIASTRPSPDGESKEIGASFTIQQRSIQSIYAIHETADLESAWGMEFVDDFFDETGGDNVKYWKDTNAEDNGNTSPTNGRLNTMKLWGVKDKNGNDKSSRLRWDTFLDLSAENETAQLWEGQSGHENYHYLRYSCMSRNRDNNGDGYIDPDEIRWYMASDIQLIGVFLGSYGIEGAARLYQKNAYEIQTGTGTSWRQHVVASNRNRNKGSNSNLYARVIWAEEGINGSDISFNDNNATQTTTFSTRCIRNMGYYTDEGVRKDISDSDAKYVEPDNYIKVTRMLYNPDGEDTPYDGAFDAAHKDNVYYKFDCTRINLASLRDRIDHELVGHDEFSRMACLSKVGFETIPLCNAVDLTNYSSYLFNGKTYKLTTFQGMNNYLDDCFGEMDTYFSVCPKGYRLPNVRELSVMWNLIINFIPDDKAYMGTGDSDTVPSRTYWSMGKNGGDNMKVNTAWGWGSNQNKMLMAKPEATHIINKPRCVRDL